MKRPILATMLYDCTRCGLTVPFLNAEANNWDAAGFDTLESGAVVCGRCLDAPGGQLELFA